ncbi:hypothetical protein [Aquimarina rubra]|uniref:Uncharacterized protein n=1 Tax=Aquimarina rubra TaxID=1920033 RepID=A0ABW5LIR9_9FLAO
MNQYNSNCRSSKSIGSCLGFNLKLSLIFEILYCHKKTPEEIVRMRNATNLFFDFRNDSFLLVRYRKGKKPIDKENPKFRIRKSL